jgi:hypothetical protein
MTSDPNGPRTGRNGVRWEVVFAVGIVLLACCVLACTVGAALVVFFGRPGPLPEVDLLAATPTQEMTIQAPSSTPLPLPTPTPTPSSPLQATATATPEPTPEARATPPTTTPVPSPAPSATPTPVVCDDLTALGRISLAPGQAFVCTIDQEQLTEQLEARPENPCADTSVTFRDDDQVYVTCRMGLTLRATGIVEVSSCRMDLRIISGTFGFAQLIQGLIDENEALVPYDRICIDDAEVSEGQIAVCGHRR